MFQRVNPAPLEGERQRLFGLGLDSLYSDSINVRELKRWVDTLSGLIEFDLEEMEDGDPTFRQMFRDELQLFCLRIALFDGAVSDAVVAAINELLGDDPHLDREYADALVEFIITRDWGANYPFSFQMLVREAAGDDLDIMAASQIASFYHQLARYVFSIEHNGDFDRESKACDYAGAFQVYVERSSVLDFLPTFDEESIEDTRGVWRYLADVQIREMRELACGTWVGISGNALFRGGLSDFVLKPDGQGYMVRKRLFGEKRVPVEWEIGEEYGTPMIVVHVSFPDAYVMMVPIGTYRAAAVVTSVIAALNGTMAQYQRRP